MAYSLQKKIICFLLLSFYQQALFVATMPSALFCPFNVIIWRSQPCEKLEFQQRWLNSLISEYCSNRKPQQTSNTYYHLCRITTGFTFTLKSWHCTDYFSTDSPIHINTPLLPRKLFDEGMIVPKTTPFLPIRTLQIHLSCQISVTRHCTKVPDKTKTITLLFFSSSP